MAMTIQFLKQISPFLMILLQGTPNKYVQHNRAWVVILCHDNLLSFFSDGH
jgi:hypothetical protein